MPRSVNTVRGEGAFFRLGKLIGSDLGSALFIVLGLLLSLELIVFGLWSEYAVRALPLREG